MKTIKNPELAGLIINLMARYAEGKIENEFDQAVSTVLGDDAATKQSIKKTIEAMKKKPEVMRLLPKPVADNPLQVFPVENFKAAIGKLKLSANVTGENGENGKKSVPVKTVTAAPIVRIFYRGLLCADETSEASASDEPYLITSIVDSNLKVSTTTHPLMGKSYTDVDAGEEREGPEVAIYNGRAKDLTVIAVMMEHDHGDPKYFHGLIDAAVKATAAAIAAGTGVVLPAAVTDAVTDIINLLFGTEDDLIEQDSRFFEKNRLINWTQEPLKTKEKIKLGDSELEMPAPMGYHFRTIHQGDGGAYRAYYRVRKGEN